MNRGVKVIHAKKLISDTQMEKLANTSVKPSQIKQIIRHDTDVYDEEGKLLLCFRKGVLPRTHVQDFFDNTIDFANRETSNRALATGATEKSHVLTNPHIKTNIIGFFDRLGPRQKFSLKKRGLLGSKPLEVRETYFNIRYPEKYKKAVPLIQDIDHYYQKYVPEKYALQKRKAKQTPFKIANTAFTTVTINVNFKTTIHTDKGDDTEGFGNLAVIEDGDYTGAETCFPQYGIGVDVRTGDILFMNVHQYHGNLPIHLGSKDAKRMAIVCYLRTKIWERTRGMSRDAMEKHMKNLRAITLSGLAVEVSKTKKKRKFSKRTRKNK